MPLSLLSRPAMSLINISIIFIVSCIWCCWGKSVSLISGLAHTCMIHSIEKVCILVSQILHTIGSYEGYIFPTAWFCCEYSCTISFRAVRTSKRSKEKKDFTVITKLGRVRPLYHLTSGPTAFRSMAVTRRIKTKVRTKIIAKINLRDSCWLTFKKLQLSK